MTPARAGSAGVLCLILGALAYAAPAPPADPDVYYYDQVYEPFFAPDPKDRGLYRSQRPGSRPSSFRLKKGPRTFRVFILGGSTAGGFWGTGSLDGVLPKALPSLDVEVINCGMSGYESYREGLVEREILGYSPDLVVMIPGHNDFHLQQNRPPAQWILKTRQRLNQAQWYRELSAKLRAMRQLPPRERWLRQLEDFKTGLRENLRLAARRRVPVVVCPPPLNYRSAPESVFPWSDSRALRGWVQLIKKNPAEARRTWQAALGDSSWKELEGRSLVLFHLATASEELGLWDEARSYYDRSMEEEGGRLCSRSCLDSIRSIAKEEGAITADLDELFRSFTAPRLPGTDYFRDRFHWEERYHGEISATIVEAMARAPRFKRLPWDRKVLSGRRAPPRIKRDLAADEKQDRRVLYYAVDAVRSAANRGRPSWTAVSWFDWIHEREPEWLEETARFLALAEALNAQESRSMAPASAFKTQTHPVPAGALVWTVGEWRLLRGDLARARRDFSEAMRLSPDLKGALAGRCLAEILSGDAAAARRSLDEMRSLRLDAQAATLQGLLDGES